MARGDPSIPLSVQNRDFGGRLLDVQAQNRADRLAEVDIAGARQQQELTAQAAAAPSKSVIRGRTQAMVMDVMALPNLLDSGQQAEAGRLGLHIRDNMIELGMDTEQMGRTLRLMSQDPAGASRFLKESILPGLQPLLDDFSEDVLDTQGNIIGQRNLKDNKITPIDIGREAEFDNPQRTAMLKKRATGGVIVANEFAEASPTEVSNINALTPDQATEELTAGKFGRTEQDISISSRDKLETAEVSTRNLIGSINEAKALIQREPNINTITAQASAITNGLKAELRALSEVAGFEFKEELFDPSNYEGTFSDLGISNVRMRGLITGLAYELATSREGGRLSDRDVQNAIKEIGGTSSDPVAFVATLDDVARRSERNFRNNFFVRTRTQFEGDLGLGGAAAPSASTDLQNLSDDDLLRF